MQQPTIDGRSAKTSKATVAGDGPQKGAAASNKSIHAPMMAGDDGIGQWTTEQAEDDKVGRGATTNHQRKSGKDKQRLEMRARGKWMAMGSERGRRLSTKVSTLAMMKAGGGLQTAKRAWTQRPTIDGRVVKASSG